jgi:lipopolysaccharide export LptBFGC system permease protein LptF
MFMCFYAANIGCMILVKNALMPVILGAWLPNLVFFMIGLILFHRHR